MNIEDVDPSYSSSSPRCALLSVPSVAARVAPTNVPNGGKSVEEDDATVGVVLQYHCDYCGQDITNEIRVRCAECRDFDLCVNCFCSGREKGTHLNTHSYIPVGRNTFCLFTKDWNADEELMLLEGVSKFGLGNWMEVADLVGGYTTSSQKSRDDCEKHYLEVYLNSKTKPLPDISPILAMPGPLGANEKESWLDNRAENNGINEFGSAAAAAVAAGIHVRGGVGLKDGQPPPSIPKPSCPTGKPATGAGASIIGYMPLRGDFDIEYDNDAELVLSDMEFRENEPPHEKELKLLVLAIYNSKLDERIMRKRVVIERNLLDLKRLHSLDKKRTKEERELHALLRPLARFNIEANHERLVQLLIDEKNLWARIYKLQEWRSLGLRTIKEVRTYEEEKRRRDEFKAKNPSLPYTFEGAVRVQKLRLAQSKQNSMGRGEGIVAGRAGKTVAAASLPGAELCTELELKFCDELQLAPVFFLVAKRCLLAEVEKNHGSAGLNKKSFTKMLKLDAVKTGSVYDFLLDTNLINPQGNTDAGGVETTKVEAGGAAQDAVVDTEMPPVGAGSGEPSGGHAQQPTLLTTKHEVSDEATDCQDSPSAADCDLNGVVPDVVDQNPFPEP